MMKVCVFCGSNYGKDPAFQKDAEGLGKLLAKKGLSLIYGGSNRGLMGSVSASCFKSGGEVIAVEPTFFLSWGATTDCVTQTIPTVTMNERKQKMMEISDIFLALPGGIGTLDEISDVMTDIGLGQVKGKLILFNINHFYEPVLELLKTYYDQGFLKEDWSGYPIVCDSLEEVEKALDEFEKTYRR